MRLITAVLISIGCLMGAKGALMGIDLGSEFIKIAAPKGTSIDIVLNEQTRRKSNNFIGFRDAERYISDDAKNLAPRFPGNMFPAVTKLVGVSYESDKRKAFLDEFYYNMDLLKNEKRGTINVRCLKSPDTEYTTDELTAMIIGYCKDITSKDTNSTSKDAVFTIPQDYDMWRRKALRDAAKLAGVNTLGLLHSTTAVALHFGIQRRGFDNETVDIVIFDMGTTNTEVGVFRFSPTPEPKNGRVKLAVSLGTIETLAIVADDTLGARSFDVCIAKAIQREFMETMKLPAVMGGKTIAEKKALFSLMRAANQAREILSSNQFATIKIENVAPDRDYSTKITREQFETECAPLFKRAVEIADKAITKASIKKEDVRNFELMGGGMRSPKIINSLSEYLGRTVDRTINGDEAAAMGATFYAARLSSHIRVKSFRVIDKIPDSVDFEVSTDAEGTVFGARRPLFHNDRIGLTKSITVNRTDDFIIRLYVNHAGTDARTRYFGAVNVSGVANAMWVLDVKAPKLVHPNNSIAVRVTFKIAETGIVEVEDGEARFRYAFNMTKRVRDSTKTSNETEESATNSTSEDTADANATVTSPQYKTTHTIVMKRRISPVTVSFAWGGPLPMDAADRNASKTMMKAIDSLEALNRATATAKNHLETYIQWVKFDGVLDNEELKAQKFLNESSEELIRAACDTAQNWLEEGEGSEDKCTLEKFEGKIEELKAVADTVYVPYYEWKNPKLVEEARLAAEKKARIAAKKAAAYLKAIEKLNMSDNATSNETEEGADNNNTNTKAKEDVNPEEPSQNDEL